MKKKTDNTWKAIVISVIWLSVGVASFKLGCFTVGLAIFAFLSTLSVVEA